MSDLLSYGHFEWADPYSVVIENLQDDDETGYVFKVNLVYSCGIFILYVTSYYFLRDLHIDVPLFTTYNSTYFTFR